MNEIYVGKIKIFVSTVLQTLDQNVDTEQEGDGRVAFNLQMEVLKCLSIACFSCYVHGSTKRCEDELFVSVV
jgi:hypothetical protein